MRARRGEVGKVSAKNDFGRTERFFRPLDLTSYTSIPPTDHIVAEPTPTPAHSSLSSRTN